MTVESTPRTHMRTIAPVNGLVLSGGASTRMGQDKALLEHAGTPQLSATFQLLSHHVQSCFISLRKDQTNEALRARFPGVLDEYEGIGPAAGLLAAHRAHPATAWLVVACDLPQLDEATLAALVQARDEYHIAVAYRSAHDDLPEPLCTLWEIAALQQLDAQVRAGRYSLRQVLRSPDVRLLPAPENGALDNINTPEERDRLLRGLARDQ